MYDLTKNMIENTEEYDAMYTVSGDKIFDSKSDNFRRALSKQLLDSAWTYGKDHDEEIEARLAALELWKRFEPRDATEELLAAQIVGLHNQMMGWLHRAALETLPLVVRERASNQAIKVSRSIDEKVATLDKHRGKGQQKIIVERVTVEPGGQAIVGNVERPVVAEAATSNLPQPAPTIDHQPVAIAAMPVRSRRRPAIDGGVSTASDRSSRRRDRRA